MNFYGFLWVIIIHPVLSLRKWMSQGIIIIAMTASQEEALYDFLDNATGVFELSEVLIYIRMIDPKRINRLSAEVDAFINLRKLAFPVEKEQWLSRRGCFESVPFAISPTRLELVNGILIPGHRCIPFANSNLLPHDYTFFWQSSKIPFTTAEGPPEEFYPYYGIFGEEYAPQYVARDNSENEQAFNSDPYDDPPEVSIKTLDMRNIYREASFVPGDRFVVRTIDWKEGSFQLEKAGKDEWREEDLDVWFGAAEKGFADSFSHLGPASCTEEQIAYAYWYGGSRMREVPAYSLEEYLYEKTNKIEITSYGIETRFWYAGREIPDRKELDAFNNRPDKTLVEEILYKLKIPVSEYVILSYTRDSLYRGEVEDELILNRLVPPSVELAGRDKKILLQFINNVIDEAQEFYTPFADKAMGPIRSRAGELHTAVIDLAAMLSKGDIDTAWLPRHTFIILSQIQNHSAAVMEDIDSDIPPDEIELEALDNSLDSMLETFEDVKKLIDEAMNVFRRNKIAVIRSGDSLNTISEWLLQLSIGGIDSWRRLLIAETCTLLDLHHIIQTVFFWQNLETYKFTTEKDFSIKDPLPKCLDPNTQIKELVDNNLVELLYEYGVNWTVRIIILSRQETPGNRPVRCVAGAGTAPPDFVDGPIKFKRLLSALEGGNDLERQNAREKLGLDFNLGEFDIEACNRSLSTVRF